MVADPEGLYAPHPDEGASNGVRGIGRGVEIAYNGIKRQVRVDTNGRVVAESPIADDGWSRRGTFAGGDSALQLHEARPSLGAPSRTTGVVLRGTESLLTQRWREVDSNHRFRREGDGPGERSRGRPLSSRETTCDLSSLSVRDLLSATAERPFARAGPMVRIRFPQAKSLCLCKPAHRGARCRRGSGGWCSAVTRARLAGYSRPGSRGSQQRSCNSVKSAIV